MFNYNEVCIRVKRRCFTKHFKKCNPKTAVILKPCTFSEFYSEKNALIKFAFI